MAAARHEYLNRIQSYENSSSACEDDWQRSRDRGRSVAATKGRIEDAQLDRPPPSAKSPSAKAGLVGRLFPWYAATRWAGLVMMTKSPGDMYGFLAIDRGYRPPRRRARSGWPRGTWRWGGSGPRPGGSSDDGEQRVVLSIGFARMPGFSRNQKTRRSASSAG